MKVTVKNVSPAPQGVHTDEGIVWLRPDQQKTVGMSEAQHKAAKRHGLLKLDAKGGDAAPKAPAGTTGDATPKPKLIGSSKDDLLVIATNEGVTIAKDASGADVPIADAPYRNIIAAIAAKRAA